MKNILTGMRVIEGSAFVAIPLAGMSLAQMGAEVIRFDRLEGGLDAARMPYAPSGKSLFWAGLNKGKKSIAIKVIITFIDYISFILRLFLHLSYVFINSYLRWQGESQPD